MSIERNPVFIRVDAGSEIGLGHFIRSAALAQMIEADFEVTLVFRQLPETAKQALISNGCFSYLSINNEETFFDLLGSDSIVVLDGYSFDNAYQLRVKEKRATLVCIDDIHEIKFEADVILNHAPGVTAAEYRARPTTQFGLGLKYALLRPAFLRGASNSVKHEKRETGSVVVCFGGADPKNLTRDITEVLVNQRFFKRIYVVTGAAYNYLEELKIFLAGYDHVHHLHDVTEDEMSQIMQKADVAVVPASGILFEAISQRCQPVSGFYADNQRNVYQGFLKMGAIFDAADFSPEKVIAAIELIKSGIRRALPEIDGRSGERILKLIADAKNANNMQLRPASAEDEQVTYRWAADPVIRMFSFNKKKISPEQHASWFNSKINDPSCQYLIADIDGHPAGSIRFDKQGSGAVLSFLLDPAYHGKNLSYMLLSKGVKYLTALGTVKQLTGLVMPDNIASIKAFTRLGFSRRNNPDHIEFTLDIL